MKNAGLMISICLLLVVSSCSGLHGADSETRAHQLLEEGLRKRGRGELQDASRLFEQALALYRENRDPGGEALALKELGNTYQLLGEHRKAIELQAQCLKIAETIPDKDLQARALVNLGISLQAMGLDDQALEHYEKSLQIAREDENASVEASALFNQASLFMSQGKYPTALAPLEAAVALTEKLGEAEKEIGAHFYLGLVHSTLGNGTEAIAQYRAALDLARRIKNPLQEGISLNSLAHEYHNSGDLSKAVELSLQALAVGRSIDHPEVQANALRGLALSYLMLSDFPKLLSTAQQLRAFARKSTDSVLEESAVLHLALAYSELDEKEKAVQAYQDLLVLARANKNPKNVTEALQALGNAASLAGDHVKAIEIYRELLAVAREIPDPAREGTTIVALGTEYQRLGREEEAIAAFQEGLSIAEREEDKFGKSKALRKLGLVLLERNEVLRGIDLLDQGYTLLEEVITDWKKSGDWPGAESADREIRADLRSMTESLQGLSEHVYGEGDPGTDEPRPQEPTVDLPRIVERALARARRLGERRSEASLLATLGDLKSRTQDFDQALDLSLQALRLSRDLQAEDVEQNALRVLALTSTRRGDPEAAIRYEQDLLASARRQNNPGLQAVALSMLATDHLQTGDPLEALKAAEEARTLARKTHQPEIEATALEILSLASILRKEDAAAIRWGEEALALARRRNDRKSEAKALNILAQAHLHRGDSVRAVMICKEGLSLADGATALAFLNCLGSSHDALQDFEKAEEYWQRALEEADEGKDREAEAIVLDHLGNHSLLRGERPKAVDFFERSARVRLELRQGPFTEAKARLSLAAARGLQGRVREAIPFYEESLRLLRSIKGQSSDALHLELQARILGLLAWSHAAVKEAEKSLAYAEREWEAVKDDPLPNSRATALHDLGNSLFLANRLEDAEKALWQAIAEWEAASRTLSSGAVWERASLFDAQTMTYDLLQQVLVAAGRQEAALEVAEQGRGRVLREAGTASSGNSGGPEPPAPAIETLRRLAREKNITVVEYSVLHDPTGALLPSRIRGEQPEWEKDLFLWVVKPGGDIVFEKFDLRLLRGQEPDSLAETVRSLRTRVGGRGRGVERLSGADPDAVLRQLYKLLIAPIADHLPGNPEERVVFIPHGPLFLVPFAALIDPSGQALLEKHTVLTAPSINALAALPARALRADWTGEEVLVVGDPAIAAELRLEPHELQELPWARKEAETLADNFQIQPLTGESAGKREILRLLPQRRLLHFASHGLLEGFGDPLIPGALVFAPSKEDNGLLTAREIAEMDLRADLAVLSACDTGRGRITSGGVSGLASALISAGVPNIVVSLWQVPDEATRFLMIRFYQELEERPDPARALRQAMLETKKIYSSPQSWAGFTLIGGLH